MVGLDTSHCIEFARLLRDPAVNPNGHRLTAGFITVSEDIPASRTRVGQFTEQLVQEHGLTLHASLADLIDHVDAIMIEQVDGRKHLAAARECFPSGKPVFIDKPLAGTLRAGLTLAGLARSHQAPWFSASALRFAPVLEALRTGAAALPRSVTAYSPCELEEHHPDLFWIGIHGVETLYALMGPGCRSVTRSSGQGTEVVVGEWTDGRTGLFQGTRNAAPAFGFRATLGQEIREEKIEVTYAPLVKAILTFFETGKSPVGVEEMIEVLCFMEAADESKRRQGAPVTLAETFEAHSH